MSFCAPSSPGGDATDFIVQLEAIRLRLGTQTVLDGVSLKVRAGQVCVLIGPSGAGKTSLIRCINLLAPIDNGRITVAGQTLVSAEPGQARYELRGRELTRQRAEIGFVFQHFNLFPHLRVLDNVTLALRKIRKLGRIEANARAMELLEWVGLAEKAGAYPGNLSGGQKQRVAICRALAMRPRVMLFDEVTSALDPERVAEVLDVIRKLAVQGMTMILVTHEMSFAREVANEVVFMEAGQIVEHGAPEFVFGRSSSARTRRFLGRAYAPVALTDCSN